MTLSERKDHGLGALLVIFVLAAVGMFWGDAREFLLVAVLVVAIAGAAPLFDGEDDERPALDRPLYDLMVERFGDDPQRWPDWVCFAQGNAEAKLPWICGQLNNGWALECGRCGSPHTAPALIRGQKDPSDG